MDVGHMHPGYGSNPIAYLLFANCSVSTGLFFAASNCRNRSATRVACQPFIVT